MLPRRPLQTTQPARRQGLQGTGRVTTPAPRPHQPPAGPPMNRFLLLTAFAPLACALAPAADPPVPADHAAKMTASQALFKDTVRDFLVKNCLRCHGGEKTKSGLDLSTREKLLEGGDRGAAVVPGRANGSRLVKLIAREEEPHMPP